MKQKYVRKKWNLLLPDVIKTIWVDSIYNKLH